MDAQGRRTDEWLDLDYELEAKWDHREETDRNMLSLINCVGCPRCGAPTKCNRVILRNKIHGSLYPNYCEGTAQKCVSDWPDIYEVV